MDYIGPFCGFFHKGKVALGKLIPVGRNNVLHKGEGIVLKDVKRLYAAGIIVGA